MRTWRMRRPAPAPRGSLTRARPDRRRQDRSRRVPALSAAAAAQVHGRGRQDMCVQRNDRSHTLRSAHLTAAGWCLSPNDAGLPVRAGDVIVRRHRRSRARARCASPLRLRRAARWTSPTFASCVSSSTAGRCRSTRSAASGAWSTQHSAVRTPPHTLPPHCHSAHALATRTSVRRRRRGRVLWAVVRARAAAQLRCDHYGQVTHRMNRIAPSGSAHAPSHRAHTAGRSLDD